MDIRQVALIGWIGTGETELVSIVEIVYVFEGDGVDMLLS